MRLAIPLEFVEAIAGFTDDQRNTIEENGEPGTFYLVQEYSTFDLYYLTLEPFALKKVAGDLGAIFPVMPSLFTDEKYDEMLNPPKVRYWDDEDIDALKDKIDASVPQAFALQMLKVAVSNGTGRDYL